jgi:MFS family permease
MFYSSIKTQALVQLPAYREDPSPRYVAGSLVVAGFFPALANGVAFPTLPRLEAILGLSPLVVGIIISMPSAARLLCNAPAGSLFDRVGTRYPLIAGFLLTGVGPFGYALGMDPEVLGLAQSAAFVVVGGVVGIGSALILVGSYATITTVTTPENRGRWLGYMIGSAGIAFPAGLLIGGVTADVYGIQEAFVLSGVLGLFSVGIVVAVLPDVVPDVDRDVGLRAVPGLVRADRRLAIVATTGGTLKFLGAVFLSTVVVFAAENGITVAGLGESGISGVILAASTVCASVSTLAAGRYSDTLENRTLLIVPSLFVIAAGFVMVAMVPTLAGIAVGVIGAGIGAGAAGPALLAYLGDISPSEDVGKLGGVYNVFRDVGGVLGPVVALPLASTVGFAIEYLACAVVALLAAALVGTTLLSASTTPSPAVAE